MLDKNEVNCCCCMSNEDLYSMLEPYNYGDKQEIYATMIAECFQIELNIGIDDDKRDMYMICKNCIYRLREALYFRLQIQVAYNRIEGCISTKVIKTEEMNNEKEIKMEYDPCTDSDENTIKIKMEPANDETDIVEDAIVKKQYRCDQCNDEFDDERDYQQHIKMHDELKGFACDACGKTFRYEKSLELHTCGDKVVKTVQCLICNKVLMSKYNLGVHMKIHNNIKDIICHVCGMAFRDSSVFRRHLYVHEDIRTHECDVCKKMFKTRKNLVKHLKIHSRTKEHACKDCGKTFKCYGHSKETVV